MCHTSRKQNGVHLTIKHNSSSAHTLGYLINHCIQHQFRVLVPLLYPLYDGRNICRTQMCRQTGTTGNTLLQFLFGKTTGAANVYQLPGRQGPGTFRRERTFTVQCIVHVDGTPLAVCPHRNAATQMADNQVQVFVSGVVLGSISPGDGTLVQGMPNGDTWHQRRTRNAGYFIQLIHYTGICNKSLATGKQSCQFGSNQASQVTCMAAHRMGNIIQHGVIHYINTTRNGFQ